MKITLAILSKGFGVSDIKAVLGRESKIRCLQNIDDRIWSPWKNEEVGIR